MHGHARRYVRGPRRVTSRTPPHTRPARRWSKLAAGPAPPSHHTRRRVAPRFERSLTMPTPIVARYRARDGTEHRVVVRGGPDKRWRVLDIAQTTTVVETIGGNDDRRAQADALARDYAAEQQAFHLGLRDNPLPRPLVAA